MLPLKMLAMTLVFGATSFIQAQTQVPPQSPSKPDTTAAATLTDGQIMHIMKTVNEGEQDLAKLAKSRAENKAVKDFAKKMIEDHKKSQKNAKKIAKKAKLDIDDNKTSDALEATAKTNEKQLKDLKGIDFDKAYIGQQVIMHRKVLEDLNKMLIPSAKNTEVKSFLETTKTHIEQHLAHAQQIQDSLAQ